MNGFGYQKISPTGVITLFHDWNDSRIFQINKFLPATTTLKLTTEDTVFIVSTVYGRFKRLKDFLHEAKILQNAEVIITCYSESEKNCKNEIEDFSELLQFPVNVRELKGDFSRAVGLETAIRMAPRDALIFACDIDIMIKVVAQFKIFNLYHMDIILINTFF